MCSWSVNVFMVLPVTTHCLSNDGPLDVFVCPSEMEHMCVCVIVRVCVFAECVYVCVC